MRKRIKLHFDIQKEIEACKHQQVVFFKDTELGDLYDAVTEHFGYDKKGAFEASVFYNLGRAHGIREERARRKEHTKGTAKRYSETNENTRYKEKICRAVGKEKDTETLRFIWKLVENLTEEGGSDNE